MLKVYLASPYTGYVGSRSEAYQLVCQKDAEIMMQNYHITVLHETVFLLNTYLTHQKLMLENLQLEHNGQSRITRGTT